MTHREQKDRNGQKAFPNFLAQIFNNKAAAIFRLFVRAVF